METTTNSSTPHAVMVCSPGMGHLIPFLELSKRLSSLHSFKVTILFISTASSNSQQYSSSTVHDGVDLVEIPAADIAKSVDPGAQVVTQISVLMRETRSSIRAAISGLERKPTVLIFDFFASGYVSMGRAFGLPVFIYVTTTAWFLALTVYCPVLDKEIEGEYVDRVDPFEIPGCKPVRPDDVVEPMLDRTDLAYSVYLKIGVEIPLFDGVLLNTWQDLEPSTLSALRNDGLMKKFVRVPVYDIGPLTRAVDLPFPGRNETDKGKEIIEWLDGQPERSVMYVSFGSGGTLSTWQMAELAWGLEMSQQRCVWVVRPPIDGVASGSYLGLGGELDEDKRKFKYLPAGFVERTRGRGLLVVEWAPQMKILSHSSIGGFLTHCGWNSTLESITNGIPMIAWPMYAEQRMNATMLVEELKVAIRPNKLLGKNVVEKNEIEKMMRSVLEGEEGRRMRKRVEDLQKSGIQALSDKGSSVESLSKFVQICKQ